MIRKELAELLQSKYASELQEIYPHAPEEISHMLAGAYRKAIRLTSTARTVTEAESDLLMCLELISSKKRIKRQDQPDVIYTTVDLYRSYAIPQLGGYPDKYSEDRTSNPTHR